MNGKIVGITGKFTDKEFPLDKKKGVALAAPGGKRVEITYSGKNGAFILISRDYAVPVNGNPTKQTALASDDVFAIGTSKFRFEILNLENDAGENPTVAGGTGIDSRQSEPSSDADEKDATGEMDPVESEKLAEQAAFQAENKRGTEELHAESADDSKDHTDVLIPIPEEVRSKTKKDRKSGKPVIAKQKTVKKPGTEALNPIEAKEKATNNLKKSDTRVKPETEELSESPLSSETTVADLEFCDACGKPLVEFAFKTGEALHMDGKFFCRECKPASGTAVLQPVKKPVKKKARQRKAPPAEKAQPQKRGAARRGPAPAKRGAAAGGGGRAARLMRQRARKRLQTPPEAESENIKKKKTPKPETEELQPMDKESGTELLEQQDEKKNSTDQLIPVGGIVPEKNEIPEVLPVVPEEEEALELDSEGDTDGVEPVKAEIPPKKSSSRRRKSKEALLAIPEEEILKADKQGDPDGAKDVKAKNRHKKSSASARKLKPEKPKGPGAGEKFGAFIKKSGRGIFLCFKYIFVGFASVFLFIKKRFKIRRLKKRINHHLQEIGTALREKRNQTAFISDALAETADKLREVSGDSEERKKLILELGEKFLHDYSEHPDPAGIERMLKSTDAVEKELENVKDPKEEKSEGEEERESDQLSVNSNQSEAKGEEEKGKEEESGKEENAGDESDEMNEETPDSGPAISSEEVESEENPQQTEEEPDGKPKDENEENDELIDFPPSSNNNNQ